MPKLWVVEILDPKRQAVRLFDSKALAAQCYHETCREYPPGKVVAWELTGRRDDPAPF